MAKMSASVANRLGFFILGLTNNFAYVIMLSAAFDLLNRSQPDDPNKLAATGELSTTNGAKVPEKYCKSHSTSTILLADTLPSLTTKIIYPILLVGIFPAYKAGGTALLSAVSFLTTGLSKSQLFVFIGVACASFSSGLGESTFVSNSPLYGESSLSGWSMGTGAAGLVGSLVYAILRMFLSIEVIMIIMLVIPAAMILAYFQIIVPVSCDEPKTQDSITEPIPTASISNVPIGPKELEEQSRSISQSGDKNQPRAYGVIDYIALNQNTPNESQQPTNEPFGFYEKIRALPSFLKYFLPLLLVYYSEYFINQGLFELIYYPEVTFLDKASQYRWFQVSYQLGVMISRSSLDILQIRNIWAMSLLQAANALLFLAHVAKVIHIPNFYLVIALIIYEGLLGGFTYVNTFWRIRKEVRPNILEYCISVVLVGDSLGIVMAGLTALPAYNWLCTLYET